MKKFEILEKIELAPDICYMEVYAPLVAKSSKPGQFLIVRVDEKGERIPLTIMDYDEKKGSVSIVIQGIGLSTKKINSLNKGDSFLDFAGPLGNPSELLEISDDELKTKKILFIAGGIGAAPIYPQVKFLYQKGNLPDIILGAKSSNYIILKEELKKMSNELYITTDDGSEGKKGFVTDMLKDLIENQNKLYDIIIAIGPMIMMKNVAAYTKTKGIKTIASLNTIMIDGTGMCGGCRVTVGGQTKFTCVDGPEFDAHLIDFDEALKRLATYKDIEKQKIHKCKIGLDQ